MREYIRELVVVATLSMAVVLPVPAQQGPRSYDGDGVVIAVDAHRVLIAISADNESMVHPPGGFVNHSFTYVSVKPMLAPPSVKRTRLHIEEREDVLTVVDATGTVLQFGVGGHAESSEWRKDAIRFDDGRALGSNSGPSGLRLADLEHVERSTRCPVTCFKANGHLIQFPN